MNPSDSNQPRPGIPALFTQPPPIRDPLITETVDLQNATLEKCLPFLKGIHSAQKDFNDYGVPALQRDLHAGFLYDALEDYPEGFVAMDASRPWIVYWALAGLAMLGEETTRFRERCVHCLLYTSDAADDMQCVDLGCRRIIKKKKKKNEFFFFKQKTAYFFFSSRRRHTR